MTTLQKYLNELQKLKQAKEIDAKDVIAAQTEFGISKSTIYAYIKGEGTSANTAYDLAYFFSKRRDARLNGKLKVKTPQA